METVLPIWWWAPEIVTQMEATPAASTSFPLEEAEMQFLLFACAGPGEVESSPPPAEHLISDYAVEWSTEPTPLSAGTPGEFTIRVRDQDGHPVEDLQQNHERMIHTMLVSADWSSFQHVHHEDFAALSVDNIRSATFRFPLRLPLSGRYLLMFGYAHQNQWLFTDDFMDVEGSPAQAAAPDLSLSSETTVDNLVVTVDWPASPSAGYETTWTVHISQADGTPVEDLVPYLGADAHAALVNDSLTWGSHTHAWFPDMDRMSPGMEMPHLYNGPEIPFVYTFPNAGMHKMWIQFARESLPDVVYTAPFVFSVSP